MHRTEATVVVASLLTEPWTHVERHRDRCDGIGAPTMADLPGEPGTTRGAARRGRRWPWLAGALMVCVVAFVLFWFQPRKLFIDDRVDEAIPTRRTIRPDRTGTAAARGAPATEPVSNVLVELARGEFVSLDHGTSGVARVLELADGRRIVRLEGLDTDNGPDLYLHLSGNPAAGDEDAFDDEFLDVGRLKGNQGAQNYDLPADTDLSRFAAVVIWCDRVNSAFGAADLTA